MPTYLTVRSETVISIQTTELQRFIYPRRYVIQSPLYTLKMLKCRGKTSITLYCICSVKIIIIIVIIIMNVLSHSEAVTVHLYVYCVRIYIYLCLFYVAKAKLPDIIKYTVIKIHICAHERAECTLFDNKRLWSVYLSAKLGYFAWPHCQYLRFFFTFPFNIIYLLTRKRGLSRNSLFSVEHC